MELGLSKKMEGILSFIKWKEEKGKVENLVTIEEDVRSIKIRHKARREHKCYAVRSA